MKTQCMFIRKNGQAIHSAGDISRGTYDAELFYAHKEEEDYWIGNYAEGFGFMGVRFRKSDCRPATEAEVKLCEAGHVRDIKF